MVRAFEERPTADSRALPAGHRDVDSLTRHQDPLGFFRPPDILLSLLLFAKLWKFLARACGPRSPRLSAQSLPVTAQSLAGLQAVIPSAEAAIPEWLNAQVCVRGGVLAYVLSCHVIPGQILCENRYCALIRFGCGAWALVCQPIVSYLQRVQQLSV